MTCLEIKNGRRGGEKRSKAKYNHKNFKRDRQNRLIFGVQILPRCNVIYQTVIFTVPKYDHIPRFSHSKHHQDYSQGVAKTFP